MMNILDQLLLRDLPEDILVEDQAVKDHLLVVTQVLRH